MSGNERDIAHRIDGDRDGRHVGGIDRHRGLLRVLRIDADPDAIESAVIGLFVFPEPVVGQQQIKTVVVEGVHEIIGKFL